MERPPDEINGNPLRWWNRLRWRVGLYPFHRCPNGNHDIRNIWGDEIMALDCRSKCMYCPTRWEGLDATGGER